MSSVRIPGRFVFAILCAPLFLGGACEKKANKPNDTGAIAALDQVGSTGSGHAGGATAGAVDTTPLPGVELGKLDADKTQLFYKLIGSLRSPCGKAHSLRTSFTSDTSCKRALYAARYVAVMLEDEATESDARDGYAKKYESTAQPVSFDTSKAPHAGPDDARIRLVEFFDYECPHCQLFKPVMEKILADKADVVSVSFMMYPIESKHPESRSAAQAAIAASQQGKFKEMHDKLFEVTPRHGHDDVVGYARELGLDVPKFEKAYADASAQVTSDLKQAENAGVDSTPTLFFNNRKYEGPPYAKYIELWIDEEVGVNR